MRLYIIFFTLCVTLCIALPDHDKKHQELKHHELMHHELKHHELKHHELRHHQKKQHLNRQGEDNGANEQPISPSPDIGDDNIPQCPDYCNCFCNDIYFDDDQENPDPDDDNGEIDPSQDVQVDPTSDSPSSPNPTGVKRHHSKKHHVNSKRHSILHAKREHNKKSHHNKRHHSKKHHQVRDNVPQTIPPTIETTKFNSNTQHPPDSCQNCSCDCGPVYYEDDDTWDPTDDDEQTEESQTSDPAVTGQTIPSDDTGIESAKKKHARHQTQRHHQNKRHNNERKHHKETERHAH